MISDCKIDLTPAIKRCESAYGGTLPCEQVIYGSDEYNKAPYATPKCPFGYQRYGSSKCVRTCNYTESIEADAESGEDPTNQSGWTKVLLTYNKNRLITASRRKHKGVRSRDRMGEIGRKLDRLSMTGKSWKRPMVCLSM